jgi:hypothetical protein
MDLAKILSQRLAEPPQQTPTAKDMLNQALADPMFTPVRIFSDRFMSMRDSWPILLPLLFLVGWRAYIKERKRVLAYQTRKGKKK